MLISSFEVITCIFCRDHIYRTLSSILLYF